MGAPVRRIEQHRDGARVSTDGQTWHAGQVVVTVPPHLAGRIDFDPLLPAQQAALFSRMALAGRTAHERRDAVLRGFAKVVGPRRWSRSTTSSRTGRGRRGPSAVRSWCSRPVSSPNSAPGGTCRTDACTGQARSTPTTGTDSRTARCAPARTPPPRSPLLAATDERAQGHPPAHPRRPGRGRLVRHRQHRPLRPSASPPIHSTCAAVASRSLLTSR